MSSSNIIESKTDADASGGGGGKKVGNIIETVCEILNFSGRIVWDPTKPKGQFRKPSDNSRLIELGWRQENYTDFKKAPFEYKKRPFKNLNGTFLCPSGDRQKSQCNLKKMVTAARSQ